MKQESKTDLKALDLLTDEDIHKAISKDEDASPELDEAMLNQLKSAKQVFPAVVAAYRRGRGPQKKAKKVPVSIRLSPEVVDYFRAKGSGWQSEIDEALIEYIAAKEN
jgi:uncharacterized protein (DUF4415 family)